MRYGAQSEYRPLKTLLLHRPQPEDLCWVRKDNVCYYNFTSPVDPYAYLVEYEGMVDTFSAEGIEIIFLTEVLKHDTEALRYISRRPNLVFMRDMATVYEQGAVIMNPYLKGRQWDGWVVRECFRRLGIPLLGVIAYPGYLEGGGNLFLRDRIGAVSLCDRATEEGINQLASFTLKGSLDELVVVNVPQGTIHLDSLFMVIDENLAFLSAAELDIAPTRVLRRDGSVEYVWFKEYLEALGFECLYGSKDLDMSYLAYAPRRMIGYAQTLGNVVAIESRGGRFIGIPGVELSKGDGGVHCMTCPILRE
jgi:arginine deiminase